MIKDPVDHHPLWLDPVSIETLLHLSIFGVLVFSLSAFLFFPSEVSRGWLIHIVFALVVTKHDLAVQLQLQSGHKQLVGVLAPTIHPYAMVRFLHSPATLTPRSSASRTCPAT